MLKNASKILGNIIIVLVFAIAALIVLPKIFGIQGLCVISGSMEPTIPVGSIVYVKDIEEEQLSKGDVIAFNSGASIVTHRIVSIDDKNKLITTKGDANNTEDFTKVAFTNVYGKVIWHLPYLGVVAGALSSIKGKLVAILLLVIGLAMSSGKKSPDVPEGKKSFNPKILLVCGIVIIVGALVGFVVIYGDYNSSNNLYDSLNDNFVTVQNNISEDAWEDMVAVDFEELKSVNQDVVGWIYVEGTDISYPIMYSGDDETYLRTTINKEHATAGSIFLEGYNLPDFSDSHSIVYGHNMRNLSMFGSLKYYKADEDYYDSHRYFQIITPTEKMRFEIFSYFDTEPASWVYTVPYEDNDEFKDYIDELIRHSYIKLDNYEINSSDRIVTLSTCSGSEMRFTIHGKLVDSQANNE